MALSHQPVARTLLHRRSISVEGFQREDGLYDIEGHLVDIKGYDFPVSNGIRKTGEPIHDMWLSITIDDHMIIRDAKASTVARPYEGSCENITPALRQIEGVEHSPRLYAGGKRAVWRRARLHPSHGINWHIGYGGVSNPLWLCRIGQRA